MKYDFDKVTNRRNTNSLKWDVDDAELPMWVADMDFQTAPEIIEALTKRASFGIFGYNIVPDQWYDAIISWWKRRHGFAMEKEWLVFTTGAIPAITSAIKRLTNVGDNVVVQTPVYDIFFHSIENSGRHVLENDLIYHEKCSDMANPYYDMDFEDLEIKLSHPLTTLMIICNPQNPGGRIWSKEQLIKVGELCNRYGVTVISDEVHCDLTEPGKRYVPFASASDVCRKISMTCIAASKTFNIAGLQSAAVVIPDKQLRAKVERGLNSDEVAEPNSFAIESVIAAYNQGEEWLDELNAYIDGNKKRVLEFFEEELDEIEVVKSEVTYLLWLDCGKITTDTAALQEYLRKEHGIYLSSGGQYRGNGKRFLRLNIACQRSILEEGLTRLASGIKAY